MRDLQLSKPTALSAVPYIFQRIAERVRQSAAADEGDALRAAFGGHMERLSCGGAALAPEIEAWYAACGLPALPGYGLTEASPVVATSTLACHRAGTVGRPLANVEVRLAPDGEILVRGPSVMVGYCDDRAATAETICEHWLHTGDLGEIDADGFLIIRGRKKELIVLSTGKKVAPTRIENRLTASPLIEQAIVFGEGACRLVALIVPSAAGLKAASADAAEDQDALESDGEAAGGPRLHRLVAAEIRDRLASAAAEEQVRDFALVCRPFSVERGELTPKLSLCRSVIASNFADELAALHAALPREHTRQRPSQRV